jgi:hypothetical protein
MLMGCGYDSGCQNREQAMLNKFDSPIVQTDTRKVHTLTRRQTSILGEHRELMLIMMGCFLTYALFLYYVMPTVPAYRYNRVLAELAYYWRPVWDSFEYKFYTAVLPTVVSFTQELWALLPL